MSFFAFFNGFKSEFSFKNLSKHHGLISLIDLNLILTIDYFLTTLMNKVFKCAHFMVFLLFFLACESKKEVAEKIEINGVTRSAEFVPEPKDVAEQNVVTLANNAVAPDFTLPAVDGKYYSLKDFDESKVLVIIFTCNHCPTAQAYEDRMIQLVDDYKNESVTVVAISPNSIKSLLLEELGYSDMGDSYEEMKTRARDKKYNFVYMYDGDTQETSVKYGPIATPHAFVFDAERKLRYNGRLDNSEKTRYCKCR